MASRFLFLLFPHNPFLLHVNNNTRLYLKLWCQRLLAYSTCNIPKISFKLLLFSIIQDPNFEQNAKKNVIWYTDSPPFPWTFYLSFVLSQNFNNENTFWDDCITSIHGWSPKFPQGEDSEAYFCMQVIFWGVLSWLTSVRD